MKLSALTALAALIAVPAVADDVIHAKEGTGFSLMNKSVTRQEDADLVVTSRVLTAQYGVRREEGREQFSSSVGLSLGDVFVVRDHRMKAHRVRVFTAASGFVRLEVLTAEQTSQLSPPVHYGKSIVTVNGEPSMKSFGALKLEADGTYVVGQSKGRWSLEGDRLTLDGGYAAWGTGAVSSDGKVVTFTFTRGPFAWVVRFERTSDDAVVAANER